MSDIQCIVVTPEKTEIDVRASAVTVPLFDGEMGILKGHSPLVGRLGYGVLRITVGSDVQKYFVEEGLVQVNNNVVSVLTDKVLPLNQVNAQYAQSVSEAALSLPSENSDQQAIRRRALERSRAVARVAATRP